MMDVGRNSGLLVSVKKTGNLRCPGQMDSCVKEGLRTSASIMKPANRGASMDKRKFVTMAKTGVS